MRGRGFKNDPNREDDPEYIVRLVGQVVAVSVETVRLVRELAGLSIDQVQRPGGLESGSELAARRGGGSELAS